VRVCQGMVGAGWLAAEGRDFRVTRLGEKQLESLDVDLPAARRSHRAFARACVDLTQRRPHLGGALGAALLDAALRRRWVSCDLDSRALSVTSAGRRELRSKLGVNAPA